MSWGIVAGVAGSIGGSLISGNAAKNAAKRQTEANQEMASEQNAYNYRMFREGRGSGGSAVLPLYMSTATPLVNVVLQREPELVNAWMQTQYAGSGDAYVYNPVTGRYEYTGWEAAADAPSFEEWLRGYVAENPEAADRVTSYLQAAAGNLTEEQMLENVTDAYLAGERLFGTPAEQALRAQAVVERMAPLQAMAEEVVRQVLSGETGAAREAAQGGVEAARLAGLADTAGAREDLAGLEGAREDALQLTAGAREAMTPALRAQIAEREQRLRDLGLARTGAADGYARAVEDRALAQQQAIDVAERAALNRLAAERAAGGFAGTSTGMNTAVARALLGARDQAAVARGEAGVEAARARGEASVQNANDLTQVNFGDVGVQAANAALQSARERAAVGEQNALDRYAAVLQSAQERAAVGEQGALERRDLVDTNLSTQTQYLDSPYALAERGVALDNLPQSNLYNSQLALQNALGFFRLGEGMAPTAVNQPSAVVAPGAGAAIGNALSGVGGLILKDQAEGGTNWSRIFGRGSGG